jgi:hypothetical protein
MEVGLLNGTWIFTKKIGRMLIETPWGHAFL